MWFHSHSTCPLCRSLVKPEVTATVEEEQVVITISPEPVSAIEPGSSSGLRDEPPSGSVMPSEDLMRKPAAIEVPRRNLSEFEDDLSRNSPASHSFRSPMSRMLSFTRMLSRGNASSPVAGAPAQSPSSNCRIAMTESDIERGGGEETR
ncbi:RING-H2 finger protein ATL2 [Raphanus sativus]|nr:RING-H2 finger protein ATL2 [Raphanus sativus]